jgi:16S rRNA C967 or C1407 C5-methylase (RsmB/RsmF family)
MGVRSVVVSNFDGRKLPKHFSNLDRILLDAPCTGMGVIAKDHAIKLTKVSYLCSLNGCSGPYFHFDFLWLI